MLVFYAQTRTGKKNLPSLIEKDKYSLTYIDDLYILKV